MYKVLAHHGVGSVFFNAIVDIGLLEQYITFISAKYKISVK